MELFRALLESFWQYLHVSCSIKSLYQGKRRDDEEGGGVVERHQDQICNIEKGSHPSLHYFPLIRKCQVKIAKEFLRK